MASVRLHAANAVLRNLTRSNNACFTIHRSNHVLCGRLMCFMKRTSPSLIRTPMRYANPFESTYRLNHDGVILKEAVVSEKVESGEKAASTEATLKSNAAEDVSQVKNIESSSSNAASTSFDESMLPEIPESPGVFTVAEESMLSSLGLGGWSPPGIVQQLLEFLHVTFDMPWWACITTLTIIIKLAMFPLTVMSKKNTIIVQNSMPHLQKLQHDMMEARKSGNYYEAARATQELCLYTRQHRTNYTKLFGGALLQAPVFISFFFALRRMAEVPEFTSFQTGGLLWFTDLSVPDQFYILPLLTSLTIGAVIKYGSSMQTFPSQMNPGSVQFMKILPYGAPVVVFLFAIKFPAAVLCYWTASNLFVLCQVYVLSLKPVKKYLKIPNVIPPTIRMNEEKSKMGFIEGVKGSIKNMQIAKELEQREVLNAVKFEEIGNRPSKRTFKFDPTKVTKLSQTKQK